MAEIRAFRGVRYAPGLAEPTAQLLCPPYDVISPAYQQELYQRSDFNAVRLEYGITLPSDVSANDRHNRAATTYREWLRKGILKRDRTPALYIHDHYFVDGTLYRRRGIMAAVRLEPPGKRTVLPHENTVAGIKSDRLQLLRACRANFSPIFILYNDAELQIAALLNERTQRRPLLDFTSIEGETHRLWRLTEPATISIISNLLSRYILYIADGHHRYETSVAYMEERHRVMSQPTGDEGFNFMLMTLVAFSDPGLIVYPIHRLVHGLSPEAVKRLKQSFEAMFHVTYRSISGSLDVESMLRESGSVFVVLGLIPGQAGLCRFRADVRPDKYMPAGRSLVYRRLPVSLLHHLVLDRLPEISQGKGTIAYSHDAREAGRAVEKGEVRIAVLLGSTPVSTIKAIADAGDRMPGKSTYFYPKLPTGLVINGLDGWVPPVKQS